MLVFSGNGRNRRKEDDVRSDTDGSESLLGPIVLVVTFFSVLTLLVLLVAPVIVESQRTYMSMQAPPRIADTFTTEYLDDWLPSPYTVTPGEADWRWGVSDPMVTFDTGGGDDHPLDCWLVRNDPFKAAGPDYLVFRQIYGWFGLESSHFYLPYTEIVEQYDDIMNYSRITIDLRYTFSVFFWTEDPLELPTMLYTDNYNITVGLGLNDSLSSLSPWTMVGKIMTFSMPGTNFVLAAAVALPIYMMIFYIGFVIIRSCIPLLSG